MRARRPRHTHRKVLTKRASVVLIGTAFGVAALFIATFFSHASTGFLSPEVKFTDLSKSGLQIVPASCPSEPDYTGQCSAPPITPNDGACALSASASSVASGQSVTLYWSYDTYTLPAYDLGTFAFSVSPSPGTVFNGTVAQAAQTDAEGFPVFSGSFTLNPTATTEYYLSGTDTGNPYYGGGVEPVIATASDCNVAITVTASPCPTPAPDPWGNGFLIYSGGTYNINSQGYNFCISNSSGYNYFVPANSSGEIASFVNDVPYLSGLTTF